MINWPFSLKAYHSSTDVFQQHGWLLQSKVQVDILHYKETWVLKVNYYITKNIKHLLWLIYCSKINRFQTFEMVVDTKQYESKIQWTAPCLENLLIYTLQQLHHQSDLSDIHQSPKTNQQSIVVTNHISKKNPFIKSVPTIST